jgi:hypothetical protein
MSEKNGSLAGSKNVEKQSLGGESYRQPHDWGNHSRSDGAGNADLPGDKAVTHAQKKATRIPHIHARSGDSEK